MAFDLGFTADQTTIADLFNSFFSNESRPEVARAAEPLGFDADLWRIGWFPHRDHRDDLNLQQKNRQGGNRHQGDTDGADDDVVPTADSRVLAKAYGEGAELQIIQGAGHRLRHDPRAMAMLLGWLDRQRTQAGL